MALLDALALPLLEPFLHEVMHNAILQSAFMEPGNRYGDPTRRFYAGPPMDTMISEPDLDVVSETVEYQTVEVNIAKRMVDGSSQAIANMARMEFMQKYIAREIRDRSEELARIMFMGETK